MRHQRANFNLHDSLNRIELVVKSEVGGMSFDKSHVELEILAIANPKKAEAMMKARREEEERRQEEERIKEEQVRLIKEGIDAERAKIWNFLNRFCEEIKSGNRLNGHNRYAPGTVKAWFSFRKLYDQFDRKHRFTWYQIDRAFVTKFFVFMEKNDYMVSAQNKYLVDLRAIVNYAYLDGIHDNDRAMQYFSKKKIEDDDKAIEIYLTETELQALYEMPLSGKQDEVRDIFLVGCYTCQRVSDYNDIDKDCFTTTAKGTPVIRLIQKKTRNEVKIPIMNPNLKAICEKYSYNLPSVVDVILNRYIKDILKKLSETTPSLGKKVTTKLTMKQKQLEENDKLVVERNEKGEVIMPRYNCVTTHTARRSGITNMYLTHKYTIIQMMHVSGHKTQKTFMDYIKLSSDEIADEIDAIANGTKSEVF
ncbi:phage integrase SAM-like domain-containing protein [Bacteroides nordii]|jgi:integrase|nr:phage integrase SAM-like domain-containing protein [Bacteroides nordii]MBD9112972.1 integrase [Bacteroides nordii]MCE8465228.1 phage integrase SAM-like domain-containing protein [Bacteroides nordii]UYU50891.1 site-specific integrase [Bacteroides nordii]